MSVGLYSGASGLALGSGLYKGVSGLWGGASGLIDGFGDALPTDGTPTLVLDFVGSTFDTNQSLSLNFTQQAYSAYQTDPDAPSFANFWVWS